MTAYVSEIVIAIRHPEYEPGVEGSYNVTVTDWRPDILGVMRPQSVAAMTPKDAERVFGVTADGALGQVAAQAIRDVALHAKRADDAEKERDETVAKITDTAAERIREVETAAALVLAENAALLKRATEAEATLGAAFGNVAPAEQG